MTHKALPSGIALTESGSWPSSGPGQALQHPGQRSWPQAPSSLQLQADPHGPIHQAQPSGPQNLVGRQGLRLQALPHRPKSQCRIRPWACPSRPRHQAWLLWTKAPSLLTYWPRHQTCPSKESSSKPAHEHHQWPSQNLWTGWLTFPAEAILKTLLL